MLHPIRLTMIIPSMSRPDAARDAARSAIDHATLPTTNVIIAVDGPHPDDQHAAYGAIATPNIGVMFDDRHRGMVATLNRRARLHLGDTLLADHTCNDADAPPCPHITHVGFMGDDHRVRTHGWDERLARAAGHWGIAYGNDLLRGDELPTSVVMGADVVRTLGHMGPGTLGHMYVDDYWRHLGIGIGHLSYRSDVVIEHLHPAAGKAEIDESYERSNHPDQYARDGRAWEDYQAAGLLRRDESAVRHQMARLAHRGILTLPHPIDFP